MRILITGASGLLGAHLAAFLSGFHEVVGIDRNPWWGDRPVRIEKGDLLTPGFLEGVVQDFRPEVAIHCAALANVDACEQDPPLAYRCNGEMTRCLARAVSPDCRVVHISTDGLFQGTQPFVTEEEVPAPRTVYGHSKWQGEREVQSATENHLILRTNFYGWSSGRKATAAEWLHHALEKGQALTLFDDFFFTPLYVVDLVERMDFLLRIPTRGILHLGGKERVSKNQFGLWMAEAAGLSLRNVKRGSIRDAHLVADRPTDMSLDSSRFCRLTGLDLPDALSGIRSFLRDRGRPLSERFTPPLPPPERKPPHEGSPLYPYIPMSPSPSCIGLMHQVGGAGFTRNRSRMQTEAVRGSL